MIKPFKFFIMDEKVKRTESNTETAKALLSSAETFLKMCESRPLTEELASPILVNAYEAAREAGQSLMAKQGYKPFSHEAVISFLSENTKKLDKALITKLDNMRELRNKVAYAAEKVGKDDAERAIKLAREIINRVKEE